MTYSFSIAAAIRMVKRKQPRSSSRRLEDVEWTPLPEDIMIEGYKFPKGSLFKAFETSNFGYLVFHSETRTIEGYKPAKRIFRD